MRAAGWLLVIMSLATTGCAIYPASRYSTSAETLTALRAFRGQTVAVAAFTARTPGRTKIICRGMNAIKTPDGEPFEEFIRQALIAELTIADVYAVSAPVVLTGVLESIDFSSGATGAFWDIALTLRSHGDKSLDVTEHYVFTSAGHDWDACFWTARALMPAVQNLVGTAVRHPEFSGLLK
jgi:hypothetical protein